MTVREALVDLKIKLAQCGVAEPNFEAALLVSLAIGKDRTFLIAHPEYEFEPAEIEQLDQIVRRRANHEPFQYIKGYQEFFGREFKVTPDVLIPRPETEILVERAIELLSGIAEPTFCEIGVGSGCIAVSILAEVAKAQAVAVDLSPRALAVAQENAIKYQVLDRLRLIRSDVFASIPERDFDMIVSNPPYVPADQIPTLQPEVREFEPLSALTDGGDGLSLIRRIILSSPRFLRQAGELLLEIGFDQSEASARMFDEEVWLPPSFLPDLQGIPRIVHARLRNKR